MGTASPRLAKKIDVFAYGIVLWCIFEGSNDAWPFQKYETPEDMLAAVVKGDRPTISSRTPDAVAALMRECWIDDPARRPSFAAISKRVAGLRLEEPSNRPPLETRLSAQVMF